MLKLMFFFFFIFRFKNNGENFHVNLHMKEKLIPDVSVPEDLVQIQAYLRWERKGKQMYTPEREKASESAEFCEFSVNNQ
jgi:alpha-glucan,water dikinase